MGVWPDSALQFWCQNVWPLNHGRVCDLRQDAALAPPVKYHKTRRKDTKRANTTSTAGPQKRKLRRGEVWGRQEERGTTIYPPSVTPTHNTHTHVAPLGG